MKKNYFYVLFLMMILVSFSCGKNKQSGDLDSKKAQLEKPRKEQAEISTKIKKLEEEIALMDSSTASLAKAKLVGVTPVSVQDFSHYIDLQGKIDAEQISYIAPPNGQVLS